MTRDTGTILDELESACPCQLVGGYECERDYELCDDCNPCCGAYKSPADIDAANERYKDRVRVWTLGQCRWPGHTLIQELRDAALVLKA